MTLNSRRTHPTASPLLVIAGSTVVVVILPRVPRLPRRPRYTEFTAKNLVRFRHSPLITIGGNGANAALVAARRGARLVLHTALGRDPLGQLVHSWQKTAGCIVHPSFAAHPTALNVTAAGDRQRRATFFFPPLVPKIPRPRRRNSESGISVRLASSQTTGYHPIFPSLAAHGNAHCFRSRPDARAIAAPGGVQGAHARGRLGSPERSRNLPSHARIEPAAVARPNAGYLPGKCRREVRRRRCAPAGTRRKQRSPHRRTASSRGERGRCRRHVQRRIIG